MWNSEYRAFLRTCPVCGQQFIGRKNRLYCGSACKARHNNDIAAERKEQQRPLVASLLRNVEILREAMAFQVRNDAVVPFEALQSRGFDPESPTTRIRMQESIWSRYGDYAIKAIEETKQIRIIKLK